MVALMQVWHQLTASIENATSEIEKGQLHDHMMSQNTRGGSICTCCNDKNWFIRQESRQHHTSLEASIGSRDTCLFRYPVPHSATGSEHYWSLYILFCPALLGDNNLITPTISDLTYLAIWCSVWITWRSTLIRWTTKVALWAKRNTRGNSRTKSSLELQHGPQFMYGYRFYYNWYLESFLSCALSCPYLFMVLPLRYRTVMSFVWRRADNFGGLWHVSAATYPHNRTCPGTFPG